MNILVGIVAIALIATALQRLTGLGFAMLVAPFSAVMLNPDQGIMLTFVLSIISTILMYRGIRQDIDWRMLPWLVLPAVVAIPLASWVGMHLDRATTYLLIGTLVIIGLGISLILRRTTMTITGRGFQITSGFLAGAGTVLAGIGGPAMTIYGVLSRWPVVKFAATMQLFWAPVCFAALATRYFMHGSTLPALPWWGWLIAIIGIAAGIWIGQKMREWINDTVAFTIVISVAFVGAVLSIFTGISAP